MDIQEKKLLSEQIVQVVRALQNDAEDWVEFAKVGAPLSAAGIQYKQYDFLKLRPFLNEFHHVLEFRDECAEGKTPVCYVRPRAQSVELEDAPASVSEPKPVQNQGERIPSQKAWLTSWAIIRPQQYEALAQLALQENWYYGTNEDEQSGEYPILRNYLNYTFKRLCYEQKVVVAVDEERNEEYAAFNTGLVDKKYDYIYALFKQNTRYPTPYWYLLDFVVAGEDTGKSLNRFFNPLPAKADYFENRIENMLFDSSTGELMCDYTHIIAERTERLPKEFLEDNCPMSMLTIGSMTLDDAYTCDEAQKKAYFEQLGRSISANQRIFNRLRNRLDDAVELAKKRTQWNYKTAIPMYYPARNKGSLLLPLALSDESHVDLALVVFRNPSGSYQGETVLPLDWAYSNSRLVARPDSDWLKTEAITASSDDPAE